MGCTLLALLAFSLDSNLPDGGRGLDINFRASRATAVSVMGASSALEHLAWNVITCYTFLLVPTTLSFRRIVFLYFRKSFKKVEKVFRIWNSIVKTLTGRPRRRSSSFKLQELTVQ